jgi:hypothetical protein
MQRRSFLRFAAIAAVACVGIPPAIIAAQAPDGQTINIQNIHMTQELRGSDPDRIMLALIEPLGPINQLRRTPLYR